MSSFIEIKNLTKSYSHAKNKTPALGGISLEIERGDIFGIIGFSGAGKSTLMRCLCSLIKPTSGHIYYDGIDIAHLNKKALRDFRQNIGMIFQHFNLLRSRTVAKNISVPLEISGYKKEEREKRVDELLSLVSLGHKKDVYPSYLSGGEKQRVGIARALANNPQVLLSDEATSALDPKTTQEILSLLKDVNKNLGVTIVLITHEMEVIKQICNKVAVMRDGIIVEQGLVKEVFVDQKDETTKQFLSSGPHEIPEQFFKNISSTRQLLKLSFKGEEATKPIISYLVKHFDVEANILQGWVDNIQNTIIGTLIVELCGLPSNIHDAKEYLQKINIRFLELGNER